MIGIVGAMQVEIDLIKARLSNVSLVELLGREFYLGTYNGVDVALVQSGIGKANAAATVALLIQVYAPTHVINTGVAGGILRAPGDVVIADCVTYYDIFAEAFGYEPGQVPGEPRLFYADSTMTKQLLALSSQAYAGVIASGDRFVTTLDTVSWMSEAIQAVDMESAAVGQICAQASIPFAIVRAISDQVQAEQQTTDFDAFVLEAADDAATLITKWIEAHVA
jgi:5''-methylthioadenosine/S-adenosylhomocysteine nucleosidase